MTDKMKRRFFQAAVVSILLYGCTTWTQTKCMEKKLNGNYIRMLQATLNKSWRLHHTWQQLHGHLQLITKNTQVGRTRHAGHSWKVMTNSLETFSRIPLRVDDQKHNDQLEPTYNSSVPMQDVAVNTSREWWTIESGGRRRSRISVLMTRHDDDDTHTHTHTHIYIYAYIYIYI